MNVTAVVVVGVCLASVGVALYAFIEAAADHTGREDAPAALRRGLLALAGAVLWFGLVGYGAIRDPAGYDLTRFGQMSRREQRRAMAGLLWTAAGIAVLFRVL